RYLVADTAGDAAAARRARTYVAHRPPRHRVISEFRALAYPAADLAGRAHAAYRQSALCLVRDAEHPFLQHQGFPRIVPRRRRQAGAGGGAQRLGRAHASENAVVVLEYVRRAGGILVEPTELGLTAKRARHWRWGTRLRVNERCGAKANFSRRRPLATQPQLPSVPRPRRKICSIVACGKRRGFDLRRRCPVRRPS